MTRSSYFLSLVFLASFVIGNNAFGHDLNLTRVEIQTTDEGNRLFMVWVSPPRTTPLTPPQLSDEYSLIRNEPVKRTQDVFVFEFAPNDPASAEISEIVLPWEFARAFVTFTDDQGQVRERLLERTTNGFYIDAEFMTSDAPPTAVAAYFAIGVEHIIFGFDHLLFVLGLLILVDDRKRLLATITAFTLAHCMTLALTTLEVIDLSNNAIEAVIALSLILLGVEAVRKLNGEPGLTAAAPWIVAFGFGLIHGLGFAGALAEIGLPQDQIPLSLLLFNLGIESGQILFVLVLIGLHFATQRIGIKFPKWANYILPYFIGIVSSYWFLERVAAIFAG